MANHAFVRIFLLQYNNCNVKIISTKGSEQKKEAALSDFRFSHTVRVRNGRFEKIVFELVV